MQSDQISAAPPTPLHASALSLATPDVYARLRRLAGRLLAHERPDHTLQPTALVHEVLLRLSHGASPPSAADHRHCIAIAVRSMRQVLVNHALRRRAAKRGGEMRRVEFDAALAHCESACGDLLALDEALRRLERDAPRQARVVELRFFAALEFPAIGELLDISARTAEREWRAARERLRAELEAA